MSAAKCLVCLLSLKRLLEVECEIPYEKFQQSKFIQKKAVGVEGAITTPAMLMRTSRPTLLKLALFYKQRSLHLATFENDFRKTVPVTHLPGC